MAWTDERVELLKSLWAEGNSASQIAKELGGVTRNAVIGKVHRLGLSNRSTGAKKTAKEAAPAKPAKETKQKVVDAAPAKPAKKEEETVVTSISPVVNRKPIIKAGQPLPPQPSANEISEEALANVAAVEKTAKKLTLMQLTERTCKWPVGDPATDDFWFCGHPSQAGKPYCEAHIAVAFQPMSSRRDRRPSR